MKKEVNAILSVDSEGFSTIKIKENQATQTGLIAPTELQFVLDEAVIVCSNSQIPNFPNNLMVDSQNGVFIQDKLVATKSDNKPIINIRPFECQCKYGECRPLFDDFWKDYFEASYLVEIEPLSELSTLRCTRYENSGIISIIDTGQRSKFDEINEISKKLKEIARENISDSEKRNKMSKFLTEKYGKPIAVSNFKYEDFGKGDILDLTFYQDTINAQDTGTDRMFKYNDEFNKNGLFFKKENTRINPDTGQPKKFEDEIQGNFYKNSSDYKEVNNITQEKAKKITDIWKKEDRNKEKREEEIKKLLLKQDKIIEVLLKAPDTEEMRPDHRAMLDNYTSEIQNDNYIESSVPILKKLEGLNEENLIDGVEIMGYRKSKNGEITLKVRAFRNLLNQSDKQELWEKYRSKGIKLENDALGNYNSLTHAVAAYKVYGIRYHNMYKDGNIIMPVTNLTNMAQNRVVNSASNRGYLEKSIKVNSFNDEYLSNVGNSFEDSAFKGGYRKNSINKELHRKINERGKEHYANLQADKRVHTVTAPIDFDNHIINGELDRRRNPSGGHSTLGNVLVVGEITEYSNGVRGARIRVPDPNGPNGYSRRTKFSTLFPEHWTKNRIKVEVDAAYKNRNIIGNNMWDGVTPSNIKVEGYLTPNTTVYPLRP